MLLQGLHPMHPAAAYSASPTCRHLQRYFLVMLLFLLASFALTFSVLMSPASSTRRLVAVGGRGGGSTQLDGHGFGSLEVQSLTLPPPHMVEQPAYTHACVWV